MPPSEKPIRNSASAPTRPAIASRISVSSSDIRHYLLVRRSSHLSASVIAIGLVITSIVHIDHRWPPWHSARLICPIIIFILPGLYPQVEQACYKPADSKGRDDIGEWYECFDRGFVAQVVQAHAIQRDPKYGGREDVEAKIEQVEHDHQGQRDIAHGGEEIGVGWNVQAAYTTRQQNQADASQHDTHAHHNQQDRENATQ